MDNRRISLEDHFSDAALALLMDSNAEAEGELLWEQYGGCRPEFPKELDENCQNRIQKTIAKKSKHAILARAGKRVLQVAASFVLVLFLTVSLITSVEALRVPLLNFLLKHSPRATTILFQQSPTQSQTQLEELLCILKTNAPTNYVLEVEQIHRDKYTDPPVITSVFLAFQNADDHLLTVHVAPAEGTWNIDTEDAIMTPMTLEDQKAILIEKEPEIRVLWINDAQGLFYDIYAGSMEKTEFLDYVTILAEEIRYSNAGLTE